MINIAIIDDEQVAADVLRNHLNRYAVEKGEQFNIAYYSSPREFIWNYKSEFDIVFMDICMPEQDGLNLSKELRKQDVTTIIIFVTNMAQFAVRGYEVEAFDFIVKPVDYYGFAIKMNRAMVRLKNTKSSCIVVSTKGSVVKIDTAKLKFVEISGHNMVYHTTEGDYKATGSLKAVEEQLNKSVFVRCNSCYLVNLRYVTAVNDGMVIVGNDCLAISYPRRKEFLKALNNYFGGTGNA